MTWFKVDDTLPFHAKVVAAGNPAMGLWVRAGAWSAQQLSDGFVPEHIAAALGTGAQARRLVASGLWITVNGGFSFHGWAEENRQPTREQVEDSRRRAREKKARQRRNTAGQWVLSPGDDDGSPQGSPQGSPTVPSRPVPTRPTTSPDGEVAKRARQTRLPADWTPTDEHRQRATETGLDIDRESTKFRAYAEEHDRRAKSWNAAFTRWLINAAEYAARDAARGARPLDRQAEILRREMDNARMADARDARLGIAQ